MKRALLIAYAYSPLETPRALRWSSLVDVLSDEFCFDIVTGPNVPTPSFSLKGDKTSIKSVVKSCLRPLWRALYWPDFACLWYFKAKREVAALINEHDYEVIISVSLPFTAHLVARAAKQRQQKAYWLMDTGDSFSTGNAVSVNNRWLYAGLNRVVERGIVKAVDAIVVTTEEQKTLYKKAFNQVAKVHVIPPMYTSKRCSTTTEKQYGAGIHIVFFGTLYKGIRSPAVFLEILQQAAAVKAEKPVNVKAHFYGGMVDCEQECATYEADLSDLVSFNGKISHDDVHDYAQAASVLLNIGNASKTQLPSKVVEYLAFGKPVINMATSKEDLSLRFFEACPWVCNLVATDSLRENTYKLTTFLQNLPVVNNDQLVELLQPYCRDKVADRYRQILLSNRK